MGYTIYKHTLMTECEHKGWSYIGQTCQKLYKRFQNGLAYTENCTVFYNAIQKYGWDAFETEVLEENIKTQEEANNREIFWISFYHTYIRDPLCKGYNSTIGGNSYNSKKVVCIETGKVYNSINDASADTGCSLSQISRGINKHVNTESNRSVRKYHWAAYGDTTDLSQFLEQERAKLAVVKCLETGELFLSLKEAAAKYNISANAITHCLTNNRYKTAGGYHWISVNADRKNITTEEQLEYLYKTKKQFHYKVLCVETNEQFDSVSAAEKIYKNGHIGDCCNGKRKTAGGYHWKLI